MVLHASRRPPDDRSGRAAVEETEIGLKQGLQRSQSLRWLAFLLRVGLALTNYGNIPKRIKNNENIEN